MNKKLKRKKMESKPRAVKELKNQIIMNDYMYNVYECKAKTKRNKEAFKYRA